MSDLVVAAFLLAAAFFLIDGNRVSPWLAGVATALAVDVKLTSPIALPFLLAVAWFARPAGLRKLRIGAVIAGPRSEPSGTLVNLVEAGTSDNHVTTEFSVDRGVAPVAARTLRIAIEFVDLSGAGGPGPLALRDRGPRRARGRDCRLCAHSGSRDARRGRHRRARGGRSALAVAVRASAHQRLLQVLGRCSAGATSPTSTAAVTSRSRRRTSPGTDRSARCCSLPRRCSSSSRCADGSSTAWRSSPSLRRCTGLSRFSALLFYQDWIGRFFAFPIALAAATWGIVLALAAGAPGCRRDRGHDAVALARERCKATVRAAAAGT